MQDAHNFDSAARRGTVHQEMASATAAPHNVKRAKTRRDLVPGPGARNVGTLGKLTNRLNKGVPIDVRLSCAIILGGPFEDVGKVEFRGSAQTNAPSPIGHDGSIWWFGR